MTPPRIVAIVLGVVLLVVAFLATLQHEAQGPFIRLATPAPVANAPLLQLWPAPEFSLTERSGRTVTLADLRGKVSVVDFFYTTCPGPCPMLSSRLSAIQTALGSEPDVRLVSISSDPEKDTPEVLQAYAQRFRAGERWLFLTGEKRHIYDIANKGFKLSLTEDPTSASEPITHATRLVLVDRAGMVRGFYEGAGTEGPERLLTDIRRLLAEGVGAGDK